MPRVWRVYKAPAVYLRVIHECWSCYGSPPYRTVVVRIKFAMLGLGGVAGVVTGASVRRGRSMAKHYCVVTGGMMVTSCLTTTLTSGLWQCG